MQSETGSPEAAPPAGDRAVPPRSPASRRRGDARPVPLADPVLAHLTLCELRDYRGALSDEQDKVSYWRRILQARLDVVTSGTAGQGLEVGRLAPVLTSERIGSGRRALVRVTQSDDLPPLPRLAELWERRVDHEDQPGRVALEQDLRAAEAQLSSYRRALHARIDRATGELIARYRQSPDLCLTALPLRPEGRTAPAQG